MNAVRTPKKPAKPSKSTSSKDTSTKSAPRTKAVKAKPSAAKSDAVPASAGFSLDPVFAALRKRVPATQQAQAKAFAEAFYKRMEDDEYPHHSPEGWAALACDMLDFARVRKAGTANVRVFNASQKNNGGESPHTVL